MSRILGLALLMLVVACAADDKPGPPIEPGGGNDASDPIVVPEPVEFGPGSVCALACEGETERDVHVCYSCRCKQALGGLPSPGELRCSAGEEIEVYSTAAGSERKVTGDTTGTECVNPARLSAVGFDVACLPGSRLGQITKNGSEFKFICRRKQHREGALDPVAVPQFDDFGIIGHNPRTGATCFWDDSDGSLDTEEFDGERIPDIDLTSGDEAKVDAYSAVFYDASAGSCTGCHDNDPFIYTTFLRSIEWRSTRKIRNGPYWIVNLDGSKGTTGIKHLTAPAAEACTDCHRIGQFETCNRFAPDSMGIKSDDRPFEAALRGTNGANFPAAFWMPEGNREESYAIWNTAFGEARDTITRCCEAGPEGDAAGCTWADMPME